MDRISTLTTRGEQSDTVLRVQKWSNVTLTLNLSYVSIHTLSRCCFKILPRPALRQEDQKEVGEKYVKHYECYFLLTYFKLILVRWFKQNYKCTPKLKRDLKKLNFNKIWQLFIYHIMYIYIWISDRDLIKYNYIKYVGRRVRVLL